MKGGKIDDEGVPLDVATLEALFGEDPDAKKKAKAAAGAKAHAGDQQAGAGVSEPAPVDPAVPGGPMPGPAPVDTPGCDVAWCGQGHCDKYKGVCSEADMSNPICSEPLLVECTQKCGKCDELAAGLAEGGCDPAVCGGCGKYAECSDPAKFDTPLCKEPGFTTCREQCSG